MNNYPKVEITALVVTYPGGAVIVTPIRDEEEDVRATYPTCLVTLDEITEAAVRMYPRNNEAVGQAVRDYLDGKDVQLDGPAGLLPSVGSVTVSIETKMLDWA